MLKLKSTTKRPKFKFPHIPEEMRAVHPAPPPPPPKEELHRAQVEKAVALIVECHEERGSVGTDDLIDFAFETTIEAVAEAAMLTSGGHRECVRLARVGYWLARSYSIPAKYLRSIGVHFADN